MKSKSLEKYLLSKYEIEKLEDLNFDEVEELLLNKIEHQDESDYDFRDFEEFKNLRYISLENFKIRNFETNELGRCKKLSAIQFSNCIFKSKSRLRGNIKVASFNNCKGLKIRYLSLLKNLEVLKISNFNKINLKCINYYLKNLEKVTFENTKIYNLKSTAKLKNLTDLEMVNCKFSKNTSVKIGERI